MVSSTRTRFAVSISFRVASSSGAARMDSRASTMRTILRVGATDSSSTNRGIRPAERKTAESSAPRASVHRTNTSSYTCCVFPRRSIARSTEATFSTTPASIRPALCALDLTYMDSTGRATSHAPSVEDTSLAVTQSNSLFASPSYTFSSAANTKAAERCTSTSGQRRPLISVWSLMYTPPKVNMLACLMPYASLPSGVRPRICSARRKPYFTSLMSWGESDSFRRMRPSSRESSALSTTTSRLSWDRMMTWWSLSRMTSFLTTTSQGMLLYSASTMSDLRALSDSPFSNSAMTVGILVGRPGELVGV
mmetsp:Transcript_1871/g.4080  ORF Transcript_1871/g.4080 Transcript_1871/m.4080 type:complete len:308 (+) Transcript_1871:620-1543(+)